MSLTSFLFCLGMPQWKFSSNTTSFTSANFLSFPSALQSCLQSYGFISQLPPKHPSPFSGLSVLSPLASAASGGVASAAFLRLIQSGPLCTLSQLPLGAYRISLQWVSQLILFLLRLQTAWPQYRSMAIAGSLDSQILTNCSNYHCTNKWSPNLFIYMCSALPFQKSVISTFNS